MNPTTLRIGIDLAKKAYTAFRDHRGEKASALVDEFQELTKKAREQKPEWPGEHHEPTLRSRKQVTEVLRDHVGDTSKHMKNAIDELEKGKKAVLREGKKTAEQFAAEAKKGARKGAKQSRRAAKKASKIADKKAQKAKKATSKALATKSGKKSGGLKALGWIAFFVGLGVSAWWWVTKKEDAQAGTNPPRVGDYDIDKMSRNPRAATLYDEDGGDKAAEFKEKASDAAGDVVDGVVDAAKKAKAKAEDFIDDAKKTFSDVADKAEDVAGDVKAKAEDVAEDAKEKGEELKTRAASAAKDAKAKAEDVADDAKAKAEDVAEDAKQKGAEVKRSAKNAADDAKKKANSMEKDAKEKTKDASANVGDTTAGAGEKPNDVNVGADKTGKRLMADAGKQKQAEKNADKMAATAEAIADKATGTPIYEQTEKATDVDPDVRDVKPKKPSPADAPKTGVKDPHKPGDGKAEGEGKNQLDPEAKDVLREWLDDVTDEDIKHDGPRHALDDDK